MKFSKRTAWMNDDQFEKILDMANKPGVINFGLGCLDSELYPRNEIGEVTYSLLCGQDWRKQKHDPLQYGPPAGSSDLREEFVKIMETYGIKANKENITFFNGLQQALNILPEILIDPNELIITGAPTYFGAKIAFLSKQAKFLPIPLDKNGMQVDVLEDKLNEMDRKKQELPKLCYVNPTLQNPSSYTMSEKRRIKLIHVCANYYIAIMEDDSYHDLLYDGTELPRPLRALDKDGNVIYMMSVSKNIATGLRFGAVEAPEELTKRLRRYMAKEHLCVSPFIQGILLKYFKSGHREPQIEKLRREYRKKRDKMHDALTEHLSGYVTWDKPDGGIYFWPRSIEEVDTVKMFPHAVDEHVAYFPGSMFFVDGSGGRFMRLNFAPTSLQQIDTGIQRLEVVYSKFLNA